MAVFAAVVREGSFTAAGTSLGITKQSISERIARLEQRLGVQLLVRTTRALELTDAGTRYHDACAAIVARADEADREARDAQTHATGSIRVTAPVGLGAPLLVPAIRELQRQHPEIRVELALDETIVDLVREGIDLAIRAGSVAATPSFMSRPLFETKLAIVAAPSCIAEHGRDPARAPCIVRRRSETWAGTAVRGVLVVNTFEAARDAALAGIGFAHVPHLVVADDLRANRLELLAHTRSITFTALWPSKRLPTRTRLLYDLLVRRAQALA